MSEPMVLCKRHRHSTSSGSKASVASVTKVARKVKSRNNCNNNFDVDDNNNDEVNVSPNFNDLPPEVLEMIMRFLSYTDVANLCRLVSKKCSSVATAILNSAFLSSISRLDRSMIRLNNHAPAPKSIVDESTRCRANNYLEYVKAQLDLLRAVTWRYTHPPRRQRFVRLCFYGGGILDDLDALLRLSDKRPIELLDKDGPARCISDFSWKCKKFMNHFEKVSERRVNSRNSLVSGCKPIDVLDCLLVGRELQSLRISSVRKSSSNSRASVSMRIRYVLERTWFTTLELPGKKELEVEENSWREQQRFMYLRLRRLVVSINEHYLEKLHYDRELMMWSQRTMAFAPKPPPCSTYSGYGEYGGQFFYYGNMNEYAFENKVVDLWRRNTARDNMLQRKTTEEKKPCYDLVVNVELKCSPELVPLSVRPLLKCDDFEQNFKTSNTKPELYLKLSMSCPASVSNRLPGNFVWELRSQRRYKSSR